MIRKFPAIFLLPVIIVGIIIADLSRLPAWIFFTLLLFSLGFGYYFYHQNLKKSAIVVLSVSLLFLCSFHFAIRYYDNGRTHLSNYIESKTEFKIYGNISDWPDLKVNRTEIKVKVDSIQNRTKSIPVYGNILLKISDTTTSFQRGDRIIFSSRIHPVRHDRFTTQFDYRRYLNLKDIFGVVYLPTALEIAIVKGNRYSIFNFTDNLRAIIRDSFYKNLSEESASLASGFLIGETRDIDSDIYRWFKDSGTLHLLAVSGSNVGLIIIFFIILLRPFSFTRTKRSIILIMILIIFNLLSFGEPSVMRASIMACLVIGGSLLQRRYDLNQIIAATACIILFIEPAQLYDVGFQLSFVIAWGLIYTVPKISDFFAGYETKLWYKLFIYPFIITIIAQIYSIGLVGLYFNQIPVISPVANLIIVPLVSIVVIGVLILLLLDLMLPILALWFGGILELLFQTILYFVDLFGNQKTILLKVSNWNVLWVFISYLLLFLTVKAINDKQSRRVLLFSLIIFFNLFLIDNYFFSTNKSRNQTSLFTVPGGVVAHINYNPKSDLIITGIDSRNYKIEEKIIYPKLDELDISKINRLFVLSSDFSAIDDLLRMILKYKIDSVYLYETIYNSFDDRMNEFGISNIQIERLRSNNNILGNPGIYPSEIGLHVLIDNQKEIIFANRVKLETLNFKPKGKLTYLVVGLNWNINWQDMINLYNNGFEKIIMTQKLTDDDRQLNEQQLLIRQLNSDFLIDLRTFPLFKI